MTRRPSIIAVVLLTLVLSVGFGSGARADRRVALVIGNSHYVTPGLSLSNPSNDAEDVAAALRKLDFEVLLVADTSKSNFDLNMAKFARLATDSDAALFYYAGHALQYQGRNYLIPVDAQVEDEISLHYQTIPIDDVRVALDRASGVKVMVLDACRNNPIVETLRRRAGNETRSLSAVRGLARIDRTQGMVIAFSTAADEVAADGQGRNSPFTNAFIKRLMEPGLEIEQLFRRVAADVNTATGGRQRPETYVSLLSEYYLNQTDRIAYDKIKDSSDIAALQTFITNFPTSSYVSDARYRTERIKLDQQLRAQLAGQSRPPAERVETDRDKPTTAGRVDAGAARPPAEQTRVNVARAEPQATGGGSTESSGLIDSVRKLAGIDRQDNSGTAPAALAPPPSPIAPSPPPVAPSPPTVTPNLPGPGAAKPPAAASAQACDREATRLAQLRSSPSLQEVSAFEQGLTCERLRPQVARLRESLAPAAPPPAELLQPTATAPPPAATTAPANGTGASNANAPPLRVAEQEMPSRNTPAPIDQSAACKKDEARLARLRANPSLPELIAFGRELACDRLRPQLARLQESLAPPSATPDGGDQAQQRVESPAADRRIRINPPRER